MRDIAAHFTWHLLECWDCLLKDLDSELFFFTLVSMGQVIHFDMFTYENENAYLTLSPPSLSLSHSPQLALSSASDPPSVPPSPSVDIDIRRSYLRRPASHQLNHFARECDRLHHKRQCERRAGLPSHSRSSHAMLNPFIPFIRCEPGRERRRDIKCMKDGTVLTAMPQGTIVTS